MIRLGILGSTRGTHFLTLLRAIQEKKLAASIEVVMSNKADSGILLHAREAGLRAEFLDPKNLTREEYDRQVSLRLEQHHVDLVVLIGYMRILSPLFVQAWAHRIINVHPSLLPAFAGLMDLGVHRAVLASGVNETGCTVHYVTKEVDAGPILLQKKCYVDKDETPESLKAKVQALEAEALVEVIQQCSLAINL